VKFFAACFIVGPQRPDEKNPVDAGVFSKLEELCGYATKALRGRGGAAPSWVLNDGHAVQQAVFPQGPRFTKETS